MHLKLIFIFIFLIFSIPGYTFQLYGHRGARGLAPENTLPGYQIALANNVDCVDIDIGMTKDHVLIAQHDLTLNPDITRDAKGNWITDKNLLVKNLTLAEIQSYDVGRIKPNTAYAKLYSQQKPYDHTAIPTLKQVIDFVKYHSKRQICIQIEIKTDPNKPELTFSPEILAKELAKVLQTEHIIRQVEVQASDWRCLQALQKINPQIKTAYLTDVVVTKEMHSDNPHIAGLWTAHFQLKNYHNSIPQMIAAIGGTIWDPQDLEVTAENLKEAHKLGLKVVVWTWDDKFGRENQLARLNKLIDMGIDGVITDRPDIFKNHAKHR